MRIVNPKVGNVYLIQKFESASVIDKYTVISVNKDLDGKWRTIVGLRLWGFPFCIDYMEILEDMNWYNITRIK